MSKLHQYVSDIIEDAIESAANGTLIGVAAADAAEEICSLSKFKKRKREKTKEPWSNPASDVANHLAALGYPVEPLGMGAYKARSLPPEGKYPRTLFVAPEGRSVRLTGYENILYDQHPVESVMPAGMAGIYAVHWLTWGAR